MLGLAIRLSLLQIFEEEFELGDGEYHGEGYFMEILRVVVQY